MSFVEVYKNNVYDLLQAPKRLEIHENKAQCVYINSKRETFDTIESFNDVYYFI